MIDSGYFIGQRKLLSDEPLWRQWPVRFVSWLVGWNGGPEIQGSTITFDKDRAIQLSSKCGWFKMHLPIDSPLPEEAVQYGDNEDQFPLSDRTLIYSRNPAAPIPLSDLHRLHDNIKTLARKAASA